MDRDGVGTERVEHQHVVRFRPSRHRQSAVAEDDVTAVAARRKKGEVPLVTRDALDGWIDFVERPTLSGSSVGRQRTDAETNHTYRVNPSRFRAREDI